MNLAHLCKNEQVQNVSHNTTTQVVGSWMHTSLSVKDINGILNKGGSCVCRYGYIKWCAVVGFVMTTNWY